MKGHWAIPVIVSILILGLFPLNNAFAAVFIDSFDVSAQETGPRDVAFSADGLTMFVVGAAGIDVNEYACGGAFDVSTCGFTDSFSVAAQDTVPTGVAFSADGLTMFVVGAAGNDVNEYACGGAFDVSTCAFTDSFDVSAQETGPSGIAFSADGLTMFVVGFIGDAVHEYALGTAFDVSSVPPEGGGASIGGTDVTINTTSLLIAGIYTNTLWIIPVIVGIAGIVIFTIKRSR